MYGRSSIGTHVYQSWARMAGGINQLSKTFGRQMGRSTGQSVAKSYSQSSIGHLEKRPGCQEACGQPMLKSLVTTLKAPPVQSYSIIRWIEGVAFKGVQPCAAGSCKILELLRDLQSVNLPVGHVLSEKVGSFKGVFAQYEVKARDSQRATELADEVFIRLEGLLRVASGVWHESAQLRILDDVEQWHREAIASEQGGDGREVYERSPHAHDIWDREPAKMTAICTIINKVCTVHASDSLVTLRKSNGTLEPREWRRSKIARVEHFSGAMSFWGLAEIRDGRKSERMSDWLKRFAGQARSFASPQEFALKLRDELQSAIGRMRFLRPLDAGLGVHFTAYERIREFSVPELFLISNFDGTAYNKLYDDGLHMGRETFHTIKDVPSDLVHGAEKDRLEVRRVLEEQPSYMLIYNNGSPLFFNPAAQAVHKMASGLAAQGTLKRPDDPETYRQLARLPVEFVARMQRMLTPKGHRLVGGQIHDLLISPRGEYTSTTGL